MFFHDLLNFNFLFKRIDFNFFSFRNYWLNLLKAWQKYFLWGKKGFGASECTFKCIAIFRDFLLSLWVNGFTQNTMRKKERIFSRNVILPSVKL